MRAAPQQRAVAAIETPAGRFLPTTAAFPAGAMHGTAANSPPGATQPLPAGFSASIRVAFHTQCAFLTPRRCPRCGDEFIPMPEDRICLRCDKRIQRSSKAMATRMARRWREQYRREMGWI